MDTGIVHFCSYMCELNKMKKISTKLKNLFIEVMNNTCITLIFKNKHLGKKIIKIWRN